MSWYHTYNCLVCEELIKLTVWICVGVKCCLSETGLRETNSCLFASLKAPEQLLTSNTCTCASFPRSTLPLVLVLLFWACSSPRVYQSCEEGYFLWGPISKSEGLLLFFTVGLCPGLFPVSASCWLSTAFRGMWSCQPICRRIRLSNPSYGGRTPPRAQHQVWGTWLMD